MTFLQKGGGRGIPQKAKGAFFQISQKDYSKKLSWAWNLKFPHISVNNIFKLQAQDNFLGRLEDLKNKSHFLKKKTFTGKRPNLKIFFFLKVFKVHESSEKTSHKRRLNFLQGCWGKISEFCYIRFAKTLVPDFKSAFYGQSLCLNINNSIVGKVCNLGGKCLKKLQWGKRWRIMVKIQEINPYI